jgi:hypothetical protein
VDCHLHIIASLLSKIWKSQILDSRKHSLDIFSQPISYLSLNIFGPLLSSQSIFYGVVLLVVFTFSKSAGGILFGIALLTVTRHIPKTSVPRDYMIISAFGLVLLFTSNQASVLLNAPYLPFGLAAASFVGLSSYLVLIGIYSAAISVAEESKLRQSIRSFAVRESRLLDSIGMAEIEQQVQRRVMAFTKQSQDRMAEETGIQSSLTEDDIKRYLEQVIKEVKKPKMSNDGNNA